MCEALVRLAWSTQLPLPAAPIATAFKTIRLALRRRLGGQNALPEIPLPAYASVAAATSGPNGGLGHALSQHTLASAVGSFAAQVCTHCAGQPESLQRTMDPWMLEGSLTQQMALTLANLDFVVRRMEVLTSLGGAGAEVATPTPGGAHPDEPTLTEATLAHLVQECTLVAQAREEHQDSTEVEEILLFGWDSPGRSERSREARAFRRVPLPPPQGPVGPSALLVGDKITADGVNKCQEAL